MAGPQGLKCLRESRKKTADLSTTLRSPGFPVELGGVDVLHAAFLNESSTRGHLQRCVAGNPGSGRDDNSVLRARFRVFRTGPRNCRSLGFARDDKGKG